jgi:hypothetical protein
MQRRECLGVLGATAAGLAAISATSAQAQHSVTLDKAHESCYEACSSCAKSCDMTFHHCVRMLAEGKKEHARALHMVADCAEFCKLSATMIARHSPLMVQSCASCAEACKACAAACSKFDSEEMKACAEACKKCEESCREMVKAMTNE